MSAPATPPRPARSNNRTTEADLFVVVPCDHCRNSIKRVRLDTGDWVSIEMTRDPDGDLVAIKRGGRWRVSETAPDAPHGSELRYARHRCPKAPGAAVEAAAGAWGTRAGPCVRCRTTIERYGPNGRPLCPACTAARG